jgi:hypothetical protein
MHKTDERAAVADVTDLARIYAGVLDGYFGRA